MILCAGEGRRLRPYSLVLAKPALPILNIPMMNFPFWSLKSLNLTDLTVNTFHQKESIVLAAHQMITNSNINLHISEESFLMGSGGAIKQAEKFLKNKTDPFVVANGDSVCLMADGTLNSMLEFHNKHESDLTLLCTKNMSPFKPLYCDAKNRLHLQASKGDPVHFVGYMIVSPRVFEAIPENEPYHFFQSKFMNQYKVMSFYQENLLWLETGSKDHYLSATKVLLKKLKEGSFKSLESILSNGPSPGHLIEKDGSLLYASLDLKETPNFEGFCVIGENCQINPEAKIKNSVLLEGSHLKDSLSDEILF